MTGFVQTRREGVTVVATLLNPPRNLMNAAMVEQLHLVVDELATDESARALVLTGGADGVFITHYDVGELSSSPMPSARARRRPANRPPAANGRSPSCTRSTA